AVEIRRWTFGQRRHAVDDGHHDRDLRAAYDAVVVAVAETHAAVVDAGLSVIQALPRPRHWSVAHDDRPALAAFALGARRTHVGRLRTRRTRQDLDRAAGDLGVELRRLRIADLETLQVVDELARLRCRPWVDAEAAVQDWAGR